MKKTKSPTEKSAPKTKTDQSVVAVATEAKTKKANPTQKQKTPKQAQAVNSTSEPKAKTERPAETVVTEEKPKKPSQAPKSPDKSQAMPPKSVAQGPEITIPERVGLTAGSIWNYLDNHGATPVAKLIRDVPEEERIIQRSIGWLAQEGKITLDTLDRAETITLK